MSGSLRRICACRDPETRKQYGTRCPQLATSSSHGTWQFVVSLPGLGGKRRQMRKSGFATKKEAAAELAKIVAQVSIGDYRDDQKQTLSTYLKAWLERRIEDGLRPSTAAGYRTYIVKDITPLLGNVRLGNVTPSHVDALLRKLRDDGRGPTVVRRIHAVLRSALGDAKRRRLVGHNAAQDVDLPRVTSKLVEPWEPSELAAFLDHVTGHRLGAVFEVLAFAGLRRGEACALRWKDVDLVNGMITVRSNLVQVGGTFVEGLPKTRKGERRVDIGGRTIGALLAQQLTQEAEREWIGLPPADGSTRIFTRPDGTDISPDIVTKTFSRLIGEVRFTEDAHLPDTERRRLRRVRLHDLRHGAASMALAAGFDIATVSKKLGHSSISITADTYSHLIGGVGRRMADAMESLMPPQIVRDNLVTTTPGETTNGSTREGEAAGQTLSRLSESN